MGVQLSPETTVVEDTTFEGELDDLRIYNHVLDAEEVAQIYAGGPAMLPLPFDDEREVGPERELTWVAGATATSHRLYLGREREAVRDAEEGSELDMGELDEARFDPGALDPGRYFWRVDEITPQGVITGPVWSFVTLEPETEDQSDEGSGGCGCSSAGSGSGGGGGLGSLLFVMVVALGAGVGRQRSESRP